jgi:FkbH-like protein
MFLQTVDWAKVAPERVAAMLRCLDNENVKLPPWLAKALLIGGHVLEAERIDRLEPALRALNAINRGKDDTLTATIANAAEAAANDLAHYTDADSDVVVAAVKMLAAAGKGDWAEKLALAQWPREPRALRFVAKDMAARLPDLPSVRLRLMGFSTTTPLADEMRPAFAAHGWRAEVSEANFGEVIPELLQPATDTDATLILLDALSFHTRDWRAAPEAEDNLLEERLAQLGSAIAHFVSASQSPLFITTLPTPATPAAGLIDNRHGAGARQAAETVNRVLIELARQHNEIILVDADLAFGELAPAQRSDAKLWFYGRIAYAPDAMRALAAAVARSWQLLKRGPAKVLALDFDNTLWGGIYGEDGVANLHCGDDAPGNAFKAFQQECLRLKSMGMVLVGLSKNNPEAITAFADHPGMALKQEDFVATAINWEPKPENIRRLAEELNLGLDSFIFLDDSPHEREAMRQLCPEVFTPELPEDPARRPEWLRGLTATWPVRLTAEDARRSDMYAAESKAKVLRQQSSSIEDYLAGLGQRLTVSRVSPKTLARAAQMHARTNQFNLTTLRLSDADLSAMMDDTAGHAVLLGHLADKFGDHGIVIAAVARIEGQSAEILSLLMSCRVVGRQVEGAFLGELIGLLTDRGVTRISGAFIPTAKNAMVRDFYRSQGFSEQKVDGERHLWQWTAGDMERPRSAFIDVHWEA